MKKNTITIISAKLLGAVFNQAIITIDGRTLTPDRSLAVYDHSPTGFAWGYLGSGAAQLALAILLEATNDRELSLRHYQSLKEQTLSKLNGEKGWTLAFDFERWIESEERKRAAGQTEAKQLQPGDDIGICCRCLRRESSIVGMLPFRAPVPGSGWGCKHCRIPRDGMIVTVCESCHGIGMMDISWVVFGYLDAYVRAPMPEGEDLVPFDHIVARHVGEEGR